MITIQNHATPSANMRPNAERLVNNRVAIGTFLAGVVRWHGDDGDSMQEPIAGKPLQEDPPSGIMDRFSKLAVTDHVLDLKVFIGNQVARRDERVCLLSGKILTLPLNLQMLLGECFSGFLSVRRFLLFLGESSLETFESRLRFAIMARVGDGISLGVSQEAFESDINAQLLPRWGMLDFAFGIDAELGRVAVCTPNKTNPLDILERKCLETLIGIADQFQASNPTTISEGDMTAIRIKLPPCGFVFHAPVVVLKSGISLLPWFLLLAIVIEAGDSKPCAGGCCLSGLGVESRGKRILFRKDSTIGLQVVLGDVLAIHPKPQAFIADELDRTKSFINGSKLFLAPIKLVLVDQHALLLLSRIWVHHITYVNIHIFMLEKRKMNILFCRKIYPLCPSPKKGRPIHPLVKTKGLSGPRSVKATILSIFSFVGLALACLRNAL